MTEKITDIQKFCDNPCIENYSVTIENNLNYFLNSLTKKTTFSGKKKR